MSDEKEIWWIFSPRSEDWANLRLATFFRSLGVDVFIIHNEPHKRMGVRVWDDVKVLEGWVKVKPVELPTADEVKEALQ